MPRMATPTNRRRAPKRMTVSESDQGAALKAIFDKAWEFRLDCSPLYATAVGDGRADDRLGDVTFEAEQRELEAERGFLKEARAIDPESLSREDAISRAIFIRLTEDGIRSTELGGGLLPITQLSGFHTSFPELPKRMPTGSETELANYCSRLEDFGRYTDEHIARMEKGLAEGFTLPKVVAEGLPDGAKAQLTEDFKGTRWYEPFKTAADRMDAARAEALAARGEAAIAEVVIPAYQRFHTFLVDKYLPGCRDTLGASELPNGKDYYAHQVRHYTTLDLTPEQIHEKGLAEVKRIGAEMREVIAEVGFDGDFAAFCEHLRTDPKFYPKSKKELMAEVAYILKIMDGKLPELFSRLPRMPYGICEVPDYLAPRSTTAYYMRPAGDGTRAGMYYVNTYDLPSRPLFELEALSLHEAVPGHHLQIALQQELDDLPMFRRFSGFTSYIEGWALYTERLGLECGFYTDPYANFGRLGYEMWRACRLVVDTGLHALGWEREQAVQFMLEHSALTEHNIRAEVDRYIAWPAQALSYKMGELKIRELRARSEERLGRDFDIREFHDVVLRSGAVPLDLLEQIVDTWLAEKQEAA